MLLKLLTIPLFFAILLAKGQDQICKMRNYGIEKIVCVCDAEYCDTISQPPPLEQSKLYIYRSSKAGLRFDQRIGNFNEQDANDANIVNVDQSQEFQEIVGWGSAMTDAAGINILSLDEKAQEKLMDSYFSKNGLEYNIVRVPMGGTDFSTHAYSYADGSEDMSLSNFTLAEEDFTIKIPLIKKALNLTNNNLKLSAAAWTAPKWMKTNGEYAGFGFLRKEMYQTWAEYFLKFLQHYKNEGLDFWAISTGNEPSNGFNPFNVLNTVGWFATDMGEWVGNHLGPVIRGSEFKDIKILALDDQRFFLTWYIDIMFSNQTTRDYIDGISLHWYWDNTLPASVLTTTHNKYPEMFILATEASIGTFESPDVDLGSWDRGERYANSIIEDIENYAVGWSDWCLTLDESGGPTYTSNFVDAAIIVNKTANEFYKQPMYYAMGHFSKFVPAGSKRIATTYSDSNAPAVGFKRPDNSSVLVLLNNDEFDKNVTISDNARGNTTVTLYGKSITTLVYW